MARSPSSGWAEALPVRDQDTPSCTSSPRGRTCVPGLRAIHPARTSSRPRPPRSRSARRLVGAAGRARPSRCASSRRRPDGPSGLCPISARPTIFSSRGCEGVAPATSERRAPETRPSPKEANSGRSCVARTFLGHERIVGVRQRQPERCERLHRESKRSRAPRTEDKAFRRVVVVGRVAAPTSRPV